MKAGIVEGMCGHLWGISAGNALGNSTDFVAI